MKNVLERALKTFWQAAIASLIANITVLAGVLQGEDGWKQVLISVGVGIVAAGFSAAWNGVLAPWLDKLGSVDEGGATGAVPDTTADDAAAEEAEAGETAAPAGTADVVTGANANG